MAASGGHWVKGAGGARFVRQDGGSSRPTSEAEAILGRSAKQRSVHVKTLSQLSVAELRRRMDIALAQQREAYQALKKAMPGTGEYTRLHRAVYAQMAKVTDYRHAMWGR